MTDLIERQTVIESIRECAEAAHDNHEWDMEQGYWNAIECIEEEPSEQSEQRWIPCSEGLPEKDGWCLVTTYSSRGELMVSIASYYSIPKIFEDFGDSTLDVIAWMPYPEPYNPNQSVNQIDAAQPDSLVRQSARWVSVGHKRARICSRCFRDEPYKFADHDADVYNFCPHCGAKMEVDDGSD